MENIYFDKYLYILKRKTIYEYKNIVKRKFYNKWDMNKMVLKVKENNSVYFTIGKTIFFLVIVTGFIGVALFSVNLRLFTMFPFRFFLVLLGIFFLINVFVNKRKIDFRKSKIQWHFLFLLFWLGYALLSFTWSASFALAIRNVSLLFMGISLIFFSFYYLKTIEDFQKIQWIWFAVFSLLVVLGFWEHLAGQHLLLSRYYGETSRYLKFRPTGIFLNQNDYATFLALSIPITISLFRKENKIFIRLLGMEIVTGAMYLIVITGSRVNILAVLLELIMFLFILKFKEKVILILMLVICILVLLFFLSVPTQGIFLQTVGEIGSIINETTMITQEGTGNDHREIKITSKKTEINHEPNTNISSTIARLNIMRNGISFLLSKSIFGVGDGNFEYYMKNLGLYNTKGFINSHNWWLDKLVNYGIIIFTGYIIFYFSLILKFGKIYYRKISRNKKTICEGLLIFLVGFSFTSLGPSSIMAFKPHWLLFAFALSFLNYILIQEEKQE